MGTLEVMVTGGERIFVSVMSDSVVFNQLIILRLRISDPQRILNLALFPDSMTVEQFRVLRLWLRWSGDSSDSVEKSV